MIPLQDVYPFLQFESIENHSPGLHTPYKKSTPKFTATTVDGTAWYMNLILVTHCLTHAVTN